MKFHDTGKILLICLTVIAAIYLWNKMQHDTQQQNICIQYCLPELTKRQINASGDTGVIQGQMNYCKEVCSAK